MSLTNCVSQLHSFTFALTLIRTTINEPAIPSTGTFSRPTFLTFGGAYSAAKELYVAYIPKSATATIESLAEKLFAAASPVLALLPVSYKSGVPSDLSKLDALFSSVLAFGDKKIDLLLGDFSSRYVVVKERAVGKADGAKVFLIGKFDEAKTAVTPQVESAKAAVHSQVESAKVAVTSHVDFAKGVVLKKLEDPAVSAVLDQATPYYTHLKDGAGFLRENAEPAKAVLVDFVTAVKDDISQKGLAAYAKTSAESLKAQGIEVYEACKAKGTVQGVKELSSTVLASVAAKLEGVKKGQAEPEPPSPTVAAKDEPTTVAAKSEPTLECVNIKQTSPEHAVDTFSDPTAAEAEDKDEEEEEEE